MQFEEPLCIVVVCYLDLNSSMRNRAFAIESRCLYWFQDDILPVSPADSTEP